MIIADVTTGNKGNGWASYLTTVQQQQQQQQR